MIIDKPNKILIIKPSALGDIVMAMPAVCCLAENFPEAQICWFTRPEYSALIEGHSCVHDIIIFNRKKLGKWWYKYDSFIELVGLIRKIRKQKFDIVFDFQGRFRSAVFAWFSGCKKRVGMRGTQEITSLFYTDRINQADGSTHLVDYYLDMVVSAGGQRRKVEFGLKPSSQAETEIHNILEEQGADSNNYAVFVPGSAVESKCWPAENFAQLADRIHSKYKCSIAATGVMSEKPIAEKIKILSQAPVTNLAGATNIPQLIALLAGARVVIANDTGPAHIAAALGVAMVLIFGLTNPARVGPYKRPQSFAAIDAEKRGKAVESVHPAYDIKNVTVDCVFEKICYQLDSAN